MVDSPDSAMLHEQPPIRRGADTKARDSINIIFDWFWAKLLARLQSIEPSHTETKMHRASKGKTWETSSRCIGAFNYNFPKPGPSRVESNRGRTPKRPTTPAEGRKKKTKTDDHRPLHHSSRDDPGPHRNLGSWHQATSSRKGPGQKGTSGKPQTHMTLRNTKLRSTRETPRQGR
ncbi:Hypothetical predicted protein, partial [Pelobates cultripes]